MRTIQQMIDQEVYIHQDALIRKCFDKDVFEWDDVVNLYAPVETFDDNEDDDNEPEEEAQEIMQWLSISEWLARKLTEVGAPVLDNGYGYWWGRTTYGQSLEMDDVIIRIYEQLTKAAA